jgi:hypothetical protein
MNLMVNLAPADTTNYMIFGFSLIFVTMFMYARSIIIRQKRNQEDYEMLKELKK